MRYERRGSLEGLGGLAFFLSLVAVSYGLGWSNVTPDASSSLWSILTAPKYEAGVRCEGDAGSSTVHVTAVSREDATAYLRTQYPGCSVSSVSLNFDD